MNTAYQGQDFDDKIFLEVFSRRVIKFPAEMSGGLLATSKLGSI